MAIQIGTVQALYPYPRAFGAFGRRLYPAHTLPLLPSGHAAGVSTGSVRGPAQSRLSSVSPAELSAPLGSTRSIKRGSGVSHPTATSAPRTAAVSVPPGDVDRWRAT